MFKSLIQSVKGTNFYFNLIMLIGAFWGLQQGQATAFVSAGGAVVGAVGLFRQFIANAKFGGFLPTIRQLNTQNYIAQLLLMAGVPMAGQIVSSLSDIGEAFAAKNWGLVFSAAFTLINILVQIVKNRQVATA